MKVTYIFYHLDGHQENEGVLRCCNTVVTKEVTVALQRNIFHQFPMSYFLSSKILGSFRNDNGDHNENITNLHIWYSKTIALHALHFFPVVFKTTMSK